MKSTKCLSALAVIAAMSTGYAGMASAQSNDSNTTQAAPSAGEQDGKDATVMPRGSDATAPNTSAETDATGRTGTTMGETGAAGRSGATMGETGASTGTTGAATASGMSANGSAAVTSAAIGKEVLNEAGTEVGEIEDIVTDQSSNKVYAVVSVGGFLGIGDKNVLVPIEELNVGAENVILMSQGTEEDLKARPEYNDDQAGYRSMKDDDTGAMTPAR